MMMYGATIKSAVRLEKPLQRTHVRKKEIQMPRYKVAHLRQQGVDLIIIPLDSAYSHKSDQDQREIILELQSHANAAGLAGTVVPIWNSGGRMSFIAPQHWHPFFKSLTWNDALRNINKEIYW
jgi:hypothetical protein